MPTITLKNVPEDVHAALKQQAKRHKRSLNQEAIMCIDLALGHGSRSPEALLDEIRKLRSHASLKRVSLKWIDDARRRGRP
jgi:plasmid stability protein